MDPSPKELFERYVWAGMTRDADAQAALFTEDGVYEAPLVPPGHLVPRRLEGREAIRAGFAEYHARRTDGGRAVDPAGTRYVLHTTADPEVFIVEVDTVLTGPEGPSTMALVYIFRLRGGRIVLLRDYFAAHEAAD